MKIPQFSLWEKPEVAGHQIWAVGGVGGGESPGWFDVSSKNFAQDGMHEWAHCHDEAANHQLPITVSFWIIQIVSMKECSNLMQNLMQIHCSTCQSFWMWGPHSTHAHSVVSMPPLTSTVKSSLFTHVHSSPLSSAARLQGCCANHSHYINNGWTFYRQTSYVSYIIYRDIDILYTCVYIYICIYILVLLIF